MPNLSLIDYSFVMTDVNVTKLAANGCVLSPCKSHLLIQVSSEIGTQILADVDAPIENSFEFEVHKLHNGKPRATVLTFDCTGPPGQCYNYAVERFRQMLNPQNESS